METIQQNNRKQSLIEDYRRLKAKEREEIEAQLDKKGFKIPFKWKFKFTQSKSIKNVDKILVMMFNKKNQIEAPKFMPIYGNIIVYKNRVYKYNPKAIWTMLVIGKPQIYCIKEKDMEPISNLEIENISEENLKSGRSTEYHNLLLQAALAAQVKKDTKPVNMIVVVGIIIVVLGGLAWFFLKG